ncbi:hypothetical protein CDD83_8518 [Cordyceps sp. RAO-2017]|nr:hypothetical protein CDD83_8518 [Cordyceps sp. RAO-2017]
MALSPPSPDHQRPESSATLLRTHGCSLLRSLQFGYVLHSCTADRPILSSPAPAADSKKHAFRSSWTPQGGQPRGVTGQAGPSSITEWPKRHRERRARCDVSLPLQDAAAAAAAAATSRAPASSMPGSELAGHLCLGLAGFKAITGSVYLCRTPALFQTFDHRDALGRLALPGRITPFASGTRPPGSHAPSPLPATISLSGRRTARQPAALCRLRKVIRTIHARIQCAHNVMLCTLCETAAAWLPPGDRGSKDESDGRGEDIRPARQPWNRDGLDRSRCKPNALSSVASAVETAAG